VQITAANIYSRTLKNERQVWLQPPPDALSAETICILLDGEYYVERMNGPPVIDEFQRSKSVAPFAVAYISHIDSETRWTESKCNERFARFVSEELVPWVHSRFGHAGGNLPTILGGLSLTGLAAAHAVLCSPNSFSGIFCQSASFWWSDLWLVNECRSHGRLPVKFRISVGSSETAEYVEHGPDLIQRTSQVASNRAMRDALLQNGCDVSYEEFVGGHGLASWKADLPKSLMALLGDLRQEREDRPDE
jgi:enterochelin esterase family protein